jgi:hypothetical protein
MKKLILAVVVLAVAGFQIYKVTDRKAFEENSRKRVLSMMESLQRDTIPDEQDAIGYWRIGHPEVAREENVNAFARFRATGGLGPVKTFSIVSSQLVDASDTYARYVEITCMVNGKQLRIRARHHQPLEWAS